MELSRTRDMGRVHEIARHPAIWPHLHDDGDYSNWAPTDIEQIYWMLVTLDDGRGGGAFMVHPNNSACYEMHTLLLPIAWGPQASAAAQLLLAWAFEDTPCLKMITHVPADNRAALRFAKAGGMQQEGVNRASFMKNGALLDQIMLGITKQEWKSCR